MIKTIAKRLFRAANLDVRRVAPESSMPMFQLATALSYFDVDLVFDVGANTGQFATRLRAAGYRGDIVSFEPLKDEHRILMESASRDPKWHVHQRGAVSDRDGEAVINIAGNSVSSSLLPMLDMHSSVAQGSAYVATDIVSTFSLDSIAAQYIVDHQSIFVKIDAQGFEWQVLEGARGLISQARGVLCELSLVHLYEGQHLWIQIIQRLEAEGFHAWLLNKGFSDPSRGRTLQLDAAFFRTLIPCP